MIYGEDRLRRHNIAKSLNRINFHPIEKVILNMRSKTYKKCSQLTVILGFTILSLSILLSGFPALAAQADKELEWFNGSWQESDLFDDKDSALKTWIIVTSENGETFMEAWVPCAEKRCYLGRAQASFDNYDGPSLEARFTQNNHRWSVNLTGSRYLHVSTFLYEDSILVRHRRKMLRRCYNDTPATSQRMSDTTLLPLLQAQTKKIFCVQAEFDFIVGLANWKRYNFLNVLVKTASLTPKTKTQEIKEIAIGLARKTKNGWDIVAESDPLPLARRLDVGDTIQIQDQRFKIRVPWPGERDSSPFNQAELTNTKKWGWPVFIISTKDGGHIYAHGRFTNQ